MKQLCIAILICLAITPLASPLKAAQPGPELVTADEALTVARNWVALIIHAKGDWGGFQTAEVESMQEFKRGERVLGYFGRVKPRGFIVISLRRELEPVKAYSEFSDLDPASNEGMSDLIKGGMESILNTIEKQLGSIQSVRPEDLDKLLEFSYRTAWAALESNVSTFPARLESGQVEMNYQAGQVLLHTSWHQGDPYNALAPLGDGGRSVVGCVATAGAQIMKYWAWPPYGVGSHTDNWDGDQSCGHNVGGGNLTATMSDAYDWANMANRYVWDGTQNRWEDENSNPLTQAHLDAVTELSYEVGVAVNMDYGVCGSGIGYPGDIVADAYKNHFRYSTAVHRMDRQNYTAVNWFELMKAQFEANKPIHYVFLLPNHNEGHSVVGDGWQEVFIGGVFTRQYHMNYGWGGPSNVWYSLDGLYLSDTMTEVMFVDIVPAHALGSSLSGTYALQSFPYRYFDQDATGSSATFEGGQYLQFLPGITVRCNSTTGGSIRFESSSSYNTRLFTRGDTSQGIHIYSGAIKLNRYGSIQFH